MKKLIFNEAIKESFVCPRTDANLCCKDNKLLINLSYNGAFGFGEKYNKINQKGNEVINKVQEQFCFQNDKTYAPNPFFFTDTGFGLYLDTNEITSFKFNEDSVEVSLNKDTNIVVFIGEPKEIISEYMSLFEKTVLPPSWAFGIWISANRWNNQKEALEQIDKLKKYDFPASVIVLEAWSDEATFYIFNGAEYEEKENNEAFSYDDFDFSNSVWPNPKEMINELHKAGLHLLLWQVPVYKKQGSDEIINKQNDLDKEYVIKNKLCVMNSDDSAYEIPEGHWFSGSLIPDFTNNETIKHWFGSRQYLLDIGVDGFKTDGGEFIYSDEIKFSDGSKGAEGCNRYPLDYTKAYHNFIGEQRVLFSRSSYAGSHTVPIHWAGDQQSQNSELKHALLAGLSAGLSGMIFWGFDLAGFAGPLPTLDLYRRATQMACFTPIMQWHSEPDGGQFKEIMSGGNETNNERSPWNMAEVYNCPEFIDEMRFYHKLHDSLRPYIEYNAKLCVENNRPMMRALIYDYPIDSETINIEDEYMFGDALLVCPLLEENAKQRQVYLPAGNWIGLFDKKEYKGNSRIIVNMDDKIPVFVNKDADIKQLELIEDYD